MGCSSSSTQTIAQEGNRPGAKPEESNGEGTFVGRNEKGAIAEDCETIADQMQLPVQSPLLDDLPRSALELEEPVVTAAEALDICEAAPEAQAVTDSEAPAESILPEAPSDTLAPEPEPEPVVVEEAPVTPEPAPEPEPEPAPVVVEEAAVVPEPAPVAVEEAPDPKDTPAPEPTVLPATPIIQELALAALPAAVANLLSNPAPAVVQPLASPPEPAPMAKVEGAAVQAVPQTGSDEAKKND
ncbi:hypothetical protein AAFF_G00044000 [Aldrovandia affinis]|uniref:Uncharacterized protein n=1 Tax=Aldrovandia affinis TaxID=143900 RepID=A0AAD7S2L4_9TELE|nr:hypothetical protein AAFF_G00044000 [Aldrovandia affinis]